MATKRCENCTHWLMLFDDFSNSTKMGECRRYPPMPFKSIGAYEPNQVANSCTWPVTAIAEFCGEFKPENL